MWVFGLVYPEKLPILLERGELTSRVRDDSRERRRVSPVKRQKSFLAIRSLDEAERISERVLDVFAEANEIDVRTIYMLRRSTIMHKQTSLT